ncbi:MAG: putative toxin-antitoxin system toxin component, PIN family [Thermomicrobiales bacterium]
MPRVVFDANVWVSAALKPDSMIGRVVQMAETEAVESITSRALLDQVLRALKRIQIPEEQFRAAESLIFRSSTFVEPTFRLAVITAKESDNRVLECAVAGQVDFIVTGDRKHLLRLG